MEPSNVPPECKTDDKKAQVPEVSGEGAAIGCEKQEYCILPISQNANRLEECDKLLQPKRVQSRHAPEFFCLMDSFVRNPENLTLTEWERPSTARQSLHYNIDGTLGEIFQPQNSCENGGKEGEQEVDLQQPVLQEGCVTTSKQDIDVLQPKLLDSCDVSNEDTNILQPKLQENYVPDINEDIHVQQLKLQDSCDIIKEDTVVLQPKRTRSASVSKQEVETLNSNLQESCVKDCKGDMDVLQSMQESCVAVITQEKDVQQLKQQESCVAVITQEEDVQQLKLQETFVAVSTQEKDVQQLKMQESCVAVRTQEEDVEQLKLHVNCVTDSKKDEDVVQQKLQENCIKTIEKKDSDQDEICSEMFLRGPEGNHKFTSGTQSVLNEQQSFGFVGFSDPDRSTTDLNSYSETSLHSERQSTTTRNLREAMLEAVAYVPMASFTAKNSLSMCDIIYGSDSESGKSQESRESIFIPEYAHDVNIVSSGAGSLKTLISSESLGERNADSTGIHVVKAAAVGEKDRPLVNSRSDEMWSAGVHPFWSSTDGLKTKLERWDRNTNLEMDEMCDHFMRCDCLLEADVSRKDVVACRSGTNEFCETNSVFKSETGNKLKHLVKELIKPASNSELASDFKKADKHLGVEYEGDDCKKNIKFGNIVHHGMLKDKYMPRAHNEHSNNYFKCGGRNDFKMSSVYSSHPLKSVCSEEDMLGDLNQHKMQSVFFQRPKHRIRPGYCCRHGNPYTGRQYNIHNEYDNPRLGGGTVCKPTSDSLEDQELWEVRNDDDCQLNVGIVITVGCNRNETCDVPSPEIKLTNKRPRDPSGESPEQKRSYLSNIGVITTKKPKASLYLGPEESEDEVDGDGDLMRAQHMVEVILAGGVSPVASKTDIRATIRDIIEPPAVINEEKPFQQPESCSMSLGPSCSLETHVVSEAGTLPKKKKKKNWFINQFSSFMRYLFRKD